MHCSIDRPWLLSQRCFNQPLHAINLLLISHCWEKDRGFSYRGFRCIAISWSKSKTLFNNWSQNSKDFFLGCVSVTHDSGDDPEFTYQTWDLNATKVGLYGAINLGVSRMISASMKTSLVYWSAASRNSEWQAVWSESFTRVNQHFYIQSCAPKKITQLDFVTTFSIIGSTGAYLRPACFSTSTDGLST